MEVLKMPISITEFENPKFSKLQNRYPMSYQKNDRFNEVNPMNYTERFQGSEGRGGFKFGGYNPNSQSTRIERINLWSDNITLRPY
jgi:hypothetical protein